VDTFESYTTQMRQKQEIYAKLIWLEQLS